MTIHWLSGTKRDQPEITWHLRIAYKNSPVGEGALVLCANTEPILEIRQDGTLHRYVAAPVPGIKCDRTGRICESDWPPPPADEG